MRRSITRWTLPVCASSTRKMYFLEDWWQSLLLVCYCGACFEIYSSCVFNYFVLEHCTQHLWFFFLQRKIYLFITITQFLKMNPTIIQKKAHMLLFYPETIWRWEKYPCYFVLLRTPYVFHSWIQLLDIEPVSNLRNHLCLAST